MYIFLITVLLAIVAFFLFVNSGVKMPPGVNKKVKEALAEGLPELITGETGIAKSGDLDIWYEKISPSGSPKGNILLVMGHSSTAMLWTDHFYQPLVDDGYQVIRYDNRDVGMSTWIKNWTKANPYSLENMAKDGLAVLDAAGVEKAHIIGASMGGMIAQRMAISHSDRVLSLTSIMSTGFIMDPEMEPAPKSYMKNFIKLGAKYLLMGSDAGVMKFFVGIQQSLRGDGPYELDIKKAGNVALYETKKRRGFNKKAVHQHAMAMLVSGSRLEELGKIKVPSLVIHGVSDPLIYVAHAQKYAPLIPNAKTLFIEGMGHDLPQYYATQIHEAIFENINSVQ